MSPAKQTVASGHHQYQQQQVEPVPPPSDNDANSNTQHQFATEEDNESLVDEIGYPRSKCSASPRNKFQVTGPTKTPPPLLMPRPIHAIAPTKRLIMNGNNGHLSSPTRTTPSHSPTSHYATPEPPIEDLKKKTPEKRQPQDGVMTTGAQNNERIGAVRPQGILVRKPGPPTGNASSSSSSATVRKAASSDQLSRPKSVTFSNSPAMNHKDPPQAAASAAATTAATTAAVTSSIAAGSSSSSANNTVPTWATTPNAAAAAATAATAPFPAKQHDIPKVSFGNTESRRDDQVSLEYQALVRQNTLLQRQLDVLTRERNELRNNKLEWQRQQHMIAERLEMLEQQLREHWVIASSQQQQQQQQHRLSQERASKRRSWGSPAEVVVDDKEPPPEAVIIANDKPMNSAAVRPTVSQSDPTSSPAVAGSSTAAGTRRCPVHGRNGRLKHSQPRSRSLPRYEDVSYRQPRRRYLPDDYYDDDYDSVGEDDDYVDYYGPESDGEDQGWPAGEYERRHVRAPTSRHMFPPPRYGFGPPPPPALAIPIAAPPLPPPPLMGRSRKWLDPAVALTCRRSASSSTPAFSPQQRRRHAFHRDGYDRGGYVPSPPSPEYEYWEQPPPPRQRYARQYDESDAYFETGPPQKPRRSSHHPHLHHRTIPPYGTTT